MGDKKLKVVMQLNKYVAQTGLCSRRKAETLIKSGNITVNSVVITDSGYKVKSNDIVKYKEKILKREKKIYILLNKPKNYITTVSDEKNRKTVMDLINIDLKARLYPVGRLDRNTTGLLLLTNDGELTQKLSHPSFQIQKIYSVTLDKPLIENDFKQILRGIKLEDGFIQADSLSYQNRKNIVLISLHSGKNHIVRRIFDYFGYKIKSLDRVFYAGLTKTNLPRGAWRFLTEQEVAMLKSISKKSN